MSALAVLHDHPMPYPALLVPEPGPSTLRARPWAGQRLARLYGGIAKPDEQVGESWVFSTFAECESRSCGRPLSQLLGHHLPFLAKLIDTGAPLSIQVHPEDNLAAGTVGKEEAWVVLQADPDAHILAGLRDGVDIRDFQQICRSATLGSKEAGEQLMAQLNKVPVEPGTIVLVPPGTVHALSAGLLIAEIQQPCDKTYRLFDYHRGRELHVEEGLSHLLPDARATIWSPLPNTLAKTARVQGERVELSVLRGGHHVVEVLGDELLLIPAVGGCVVETQDERQRLEPGDLRVCAWGKIECHVDPGGMAVVGRMLSPVWHAVADMIG